MRPMDGPVVDQFGDLSPYSSSTYVRRWDYALLLFVGGWFMSTWMINEVLWRVVLPLIGEGGWPVGYVNEMSLKGWAWAISLGGVYSSDMKEWTLFWDTGTVIAYLFSMIAGVSIGALLGYLASKPRQNVWHVDGPQLRWGKEAVASAKAQTQKLCAGKRGFLKLHPDLYLPKQHWTRHMLLAGGVGSGKTQILLPIIRQLVKMKAKAFIYDVKGDFTSKFPDAILFSPWDRRSAVWDIGADVIGPTQASAFASAMIPTEQGQGKFWSESAQSVLTGVIRSLQNDYGTEWGWGDLAKRMNLSSEDLYELMREHYAPASVFLENPTSSTTSGVMGSVKSATRFFDDLASAWGNPDYSERSNPINPRERGQPLSLKSWISDGFQGCPTIIVQAGKDPGLTARYIGAMVSYLAQEIISPAFPDNEMGRTIAFVLDELGSLSKLDLPPLIDKGRSKGCVCILGMQDFAQLSMVYGPEQAKAIVSMVATHVVCQTNGGETREALANLFGQRRVAVRNLSGGQGSINEAVQEEVRAVVFPTVLTTWLGKQIGKKKQWPHGFAIRALVSLGSDPLILDFPGCVIKDRRQSFKEAKWVNTPLKVSAERREKSVEGPTTPSPSPPVVESLYEDYGDEIYSENCGDLEPEKVIEFGESSLDSFVVDGDKNRT